MKAKTDKPSASKKPLGALETITPGLIPETGMITADELARRLDLQHVPHLKAELETLGVPHVSINGKRVYRCADIGSLIPKMKR